MSERQDPFDQLVAEMGRVIDALRDRVNRLDSESERRRDQLTRLEAANAILMAEEPPKPKGKGGGGNRGQWTEERRRQQSERMKARLAGKKTPGAGHSGGDGARPLGADAAEDA